MKTFFNLLFLLLINSQMIAQNCNPLFDSTFGIAGLAIGSTISENTKTLLSKNILVQADSNFIQIGSLTGGKNSYGFSAVRYLRNGKVDTSFGDHGKAIIHIGQIDDHTSVGRLQSNGKIIIAGHTRNDTSSESAMVRLNKDGSLDKSFGNQGIVLTSVGQRYDALADLVIRPDGKIIAAGNTLDEKNISSLAILRYNSDGSLDKSFGNEGKVVTHVGPFITYIGSVYYGTYSNDYANSVLLQQDGKIVVGAQTYLSSNCNDYYGSPYCGDAFALIRYTVDGVIDSTFGKNGIALDSVDLPYARNIALQLNGKILVSGNTWNDNRTGFITLRFNEEGRLDEEFGLKGRAYTFFNDVYFTMAPNSLLVQVDGKIIIAGQTTNDLTKNFIVVKYTQDGILDSNFNGNGAFIFGSGQLGNNDELSGLALQDNQIILSAFKYDADSKIYLVRVNSNEKQSSLIYPGGLINLCEGESIILKSSISGNNEWFLNNRKIIGVDSNTFKAEATGQYSVGKISANKCEISTPVYIMVHDRPLKPSIIYNYATFPYQLTTRTGYYSYKWYFNDVIIPGAKANSLLPNKNGLYKVEVFNEQGCNSISDSYNLIVLAAADIQLGDLNLKYYPNPARNAFYVDIPQSTTKNIFLDIYDLQGKLLIKQSLLPARNEISTYSLSDGMYLVKIFNEKAKAFKKLLVKK